ncbi:MAG: hypothetical protein L0J02_13410, partial [Tetragenococcus koreensis]|nr:hypothetical protein [Tetragenococcus koreensis]
SILIAFASLILSIYVAYSNSIRVDVNVSEKATWIYGIPVNYQGAEPEFADNRRNPVVVTVRIVNPSNKDISFFDLQVINTEKEKKKKFTVLSQTLFRDLYKVESMPKTANISEDVITPLNIPEGNFGLLKARSLTVLDLPFYLDNHDINNVKIVFNIAKRKNFFRRYIKKGKGLYENSPYVSFEKTSIIDQTKKISNQQKINTQKEAGDETCSK